MGTDAGPSGPPPYGRITPLNTLYGEHHTYGVRMLASGRLQATGFVDASPVHWDTNHRRLYAFSAFVYWAAVSRGSHKNAHAVSISASKVTTRMRIGAVA